MSKAEIPGPWRICDTQNAGWKYERESSFGRTRPRWYDAVSMYLKQLQWEGTDSVALASDKK
jgi:hypothetical protein